MENNLLTIQGSFKGIKGDFFKNIIILFCISVVFLISKSIKGQYYVEYNINSFISFLIDLKHLSIVIIICFIHLLNLVLLFMSLNIVYKLIKLFYEYKKVTVFDFSSGKITTTAYSFPFNRVVEENKFDEIINVNISQGLIHRIFSTGNLHIEYLAYNKVDSQLRTMEINCVDNPLNIKPNLI